MDRIKLLLIALLCCLAVIASSQSINDPQWGSAPVGNVTAIKYAPSGAFVLTFGNNEVRLWRTSNGALMWVRSVPNLVDAGFDPASSNVLASTNSAILRYSVLGGIAGTNFSADPAAKGYFGWSPDGTTLAASLDGTTTTLYNSSGVLQSSFASSAGVATPTVQFFYSSSQPLRILVGTNGYELDGTFVGSYRGAGGSSAQAAAITTDGLVNNVFEIEGSAGTYTSLYAINPNNRTQRFAPVDISSIGITPKALSIAVDKRHSTIAVPGTSGGNGLVWLLKGLDGSVNGSVVTGYAGTSKSVAFSPTDDEFALISNVGSGTDYKLELYVLNGPRTGATRAWVQNVLGTSGITQLAIGAINPAAANSLTVVSASNASASGQVLRSPAGTLFKAFADTLWTGTRPKQLSTSPDGKYLAVVFNNSGANLKVYDLTSATIATYSGHVTGAAFYNNSDMVVDGPTSVRVSGATITSISYPWSDRGFIADPAVSPNLAKAAMFDASTGEMLVYTVASGASGRTFLADTIADYGFLSNTDLFTVVINNAGASPSAKITVYGVAGNVLSLKSSKTFTTTVLPGGTFGSWSATLSRTGKWAAFTDAQTSSTGDTVNTVRFYNWLDFSTTTSQVLYPGLIKCLAFNADSARLNFGTTAGAVGSLNVPVFVKTLSLNRTTQNGGANVVATVTISEPGKPGGTPVNPSATGDLDVPKVVIVPEGLTSTTFTVSTHGTNSDHAETVSVATDFGGTVSAPITIRANTINSVNVSANPVQGGSSVDVTVAIFGNAGPGGSTIDVQSYNTNLVLTSPTVFIPEGENSVTFTADTHVVAKDVNVRVTAGLNGSSGQKVFKIWQPSATELSLDTSELLGGGTLNGTVTISDPAPSIAGVTVVISSDTTGITIGTVTVPKDATTANFVINTSTVSSDALVTLTATSGGGTPTASFTVKARTITSFGITETSSYGGAALHGSLTISTPAPAGGIDVDISSDNSAITGTTVTVLAGQTSVNFTVDTIPVATDQACTITATYGSSSLNDTCTITAATIKTLTITETSVKGGTSINVQVSLNSYPPVGGIDVPVTSNNPAVDGGTVHVDAGMLTGSSTITTHAVGANVAVLVTGTLNGTRSKSVTVLAPVATLKVSPKTFHGGASVTGTITLDGPAPSGYTWTITAPSPLSAPASVTFTPGATTASFTINSSTVVTQASVSVKAKRAPKTISFRVTVNP